MVDSMTGAADPQAASPVPPGTGWPEDPATPATPVADSPAAVRRLAATAGTLAELTARQSVCRACPRLVAWREQVAVTKRRSFRAERYWGRPIPGWGLEQPRVLIVGLAPAAHGGNRTGRVFTGDRSGDVLYASLWRVGLAAQPTSVAAGDGQRLLGARMVAAVRCAPPENKPSVAERDTCAPWLTAELGFVADGVRSIVCLGHFAWQVIWPQLADAGFAVPRPRPAFGHGAEALVPRRYRAGHAGGTGRVGGTRRAAGPGGPGQPDRAGQVGRVEAAGRPRVAGGAAGAGSAGGAAGTGSAGGAGGAGGTGNAGGAAGIAGAGSAGGAGETSVLVIGCYHPSQQNTFTGRVTDAMLDAVFQRARLHAGL